MGILAVALDDPFLPDRRFLVNVSFTPAEEILAYVFRDRTLARAVVSPIGISADVKAFERLEFLGDRVLGLLLAETLRSSFPDDQEGGLAERLAVLASGEVLADVARESGLERAAGIEELVESARLRAAIVEASLAALYLDGGMDAARAFFERFFLARLMAMDEPPRDPKMDLQEWADRHAPNPPDYEIVERDGPAHRPVFRVRVSVGGCVPEEGVSTTRRGAEKAAAAAMLFQIRAS